MGNLISFMKEVADGLRESGNFGTAHIYRSSLSAILAFHGSDKLPFRKVSQEFLKSFESYLRGRNCSWNTVSTYMRTLRAVYNRAVDRHLAPYVPHHFRYVYTGTRADRKRALDKEDMERLMKELPKDHWILYNIQIIQFGRTICTARNPKCGDCSLQKYCKEYKIKGKV